MYVCVLPKSCLESSYCILAWTTKRWSHTIKNPYLCVNRQSLNTVVQTMIAVLNVKMKYLAKRYRQLFSKPANIYYTYQLYVGIASVHRMAQQTRITLKMIETLT